MPDIAGDIRTMWSNGSRSILAAFLVLIASLIFFAAVTILAFYTRTPPFRPLSYENPARVLNQDRTLKIGEPITIATKHCNSSGKDIAVEGSFGMRNVNTGQLVPQLYNIVSSTNVVTSTGQSISVGTWSPGCTDIMARLSLIGESVGVWRLEGRAIARSDQNQTQTVPWFTEEFEVTQ